MFVSDNFVFLHLQKAAGTFVVDTLRQTLPGEVRDGHAPLTDGKRGRLVAAAIRDPWDWYVSLWSYGCMDQGAVHGRLTQPHGQMVYHTLRSVLAGRTHPLDAWRHIQRDRSRDPETWRALYASPDAPELFRGWLRTVLTDPGCGHLPDTYSALPMCGNVGYMTFRVLKLFTDWDAWQKDGRRVQTPKDALDFYHGHCIVDQVLRTEHMEADLDRLLATLSVTRDGVGSAKTNRSQRRGYDFYYDAETIDLVLQKDRMIVDAFGYSPPEVP